MEHALAPPLTFEAYGVVLSLDFEDEDLASTAHAALPTGAQIVPVGPGVHRRTVDPAGRLWPPPLGSSDNPVPTKALPAARLAVGLRHFVALHSPELFVHAGVVAVGGRALVLPGRSRAGKTSLVAALLRHGADYLSDEYAVIDSHGCVAPFPEALSVRDRDAPGARDVSPETLGGRLATDPVSAGLIVATRYRKGAEWDPRAVSSGEAMLHMLRHTVAARSQSERALRRVRLLCEPSRAFEGPRGEAGPVAADLMARMRALA